MNKLSTSDTDSVQRNSPLELCKVDGYMSDVQLLEVLSTIERYIEEYGSNYSTLSEVRKAASLKHKNIHSKVIQIKLIGAERSYNNIVSYSSELETKLQAYKIKWSLMNLKGSWNADNFTGFNSFDFLKAASNLPTSNNQQRLILDLEQRISILENKISAVQSSVPSDKLIVSNNEEYLKDTLDSLTDKISNLEIQISHQNRMIDELANKVHGHVDNLHSKIDQPVERSESGNDDSYLNASTESRCMVMLESASYQNHSVGENLLHLSNEDCNSFPFNKIKEDSSGMCDSAIKMEEDSMQETESSFSSNISIKVPILHIEKKNISEQVFTSDRNTDSVNKDGFNPICEIQKDGLINQSRALGKYLFPEPNGLINEQILKNVCCNIIPKVFSYCSDLQKSLHHYKQSNHANVLICEEVTSMLNSAEKWTNSMLKIQKQFFKNSSSKCTPMKYYKGVHDVAFPCLFQGHKHSIADCKDFFKSSPSKRVQSRKSFNYKYCSVCLQSNSCCKFKNCSNLKFMPDILVCQECKLISNSSGKGCYSVLFCLNANHSKPSNTDILKALTYYIPSFDSSRLKAPVKMAFKHNNFKLMKRQNKQSLNLLELRFKRPVECISTTSTGGLTSSKSVDSLLPEVYEQVCSSGSDLYYSKHRNTQIAGRVTNFWHNVTNNNIDKG